MKRILSYFFPFTKKIQSELNGVLEINWHNGIKLLDSKNANYSYGSLQRILKSGLNKIDLKNTKTILVLGLGGGSVIHTLLNDFNFTHKITAIDVDKVIIEIAKNEFDISGNEFLEIIQNDAMDYLKSITKKFDLIIIDLFIDTKVPDFCFSDEFWRLIERRTENYAQVIFNASLNSLEINNFNKIREDLKECFSFQKLNKVEGTNTLFIGRKIS